MPPTAVVQERAADSSTIKLARDITPDDPEPPASEQEVAAAAGARDSHETQYVDTPETGEDQTINDEGDQNESDQHEESTVKTTSNLSITVA